MSEYVVNRPNEPAMEAALRENFSNAAGTVLRLAWQAGLSTPVRFCNFSAN